MCRDSRCILTKLQMDAINLISKDARFPDAPITIPEEQYQPAGQYFADGYVARWIRCYN